LIVQLEFAATDVPQLLVWVKSPGLVPVNEMLTLVTALLVLLVSVKGCAVLELPTPMLPKLKLAGVSVTAPTPVPDSVDDCVPALSFTVIEAERDPAAVGVNVTLIVQLVFAASDVPQLLVCAKSPEFVPVTETLMPVSAEVVALVSVSGCDALVVPMFWLPNVKLAGVSVTPPTPVPASVDDCVPALSVTETVAEREPAADGVNVTLIVQLEFAATVVPQLLVCAKSPALVPVMATLTPVSAVV
jgi:hypothetical protein